MEAARVKFYNLSLQERARWIAGQAGLTADEVTALTGPGGLTLEQADHMIENVVGLHALPLGIAQNFQVNGRDVLVPMVIEEPSVVAGASFMARLARPAGGFVAHTTAPEMIGQMQVHRPGQPRAGAPDAARAPGGTAGRSGDDRPGAGAPGRRPARPGGAPDRRHRPLGRSWWCT